MTLIAEKDGREVAKIHGPYRSEYVLEYRNPGSVQVRRVNRSNVQALRVLAELVYPDLVWTGWSERVDGVGVCSLHSEMI
jgi:hypothetical protein